MKRKIMFSALLLLTVLSVNSQDSDSKNLLKRGKSYIEVNDYVNGIDLLTSAIQVDPDLKEAYFLRSQAFEKLDSLERALQDYNSYVTLLKRPNEEDYYKLCILSNALNLYDKAISYANSAIKVKKNFLPAYQEMFKAQMQLKEYNKALFTAEQAIDIKNSKENFYNKALVQYYLGEYEKSLANFQVALSKDDEYLPALLGKAKSFYELNKLTSGLATINLALEMDESCKECLLVKGQINYKMVEYQDAVNDISKVIVLYPNDKDIDKWYFQRGLYYAALNQQMNGIIDFTTVISNNKDFAIAYYERGKLCEKAYRKEDATFDYEHFIMMVSDESGFSEEIEDARNRIYNLNREENIPSLVIEEPIQREDKKLDVSKDIEFFNLKGKILDQSRINYLKINGKDIPISESAIAETYEFEYIVDIPESNEVLFEIADIYDNKYESTFSIRRTETESPKIYLFDPYTPDNKIVYIEGSPTSIYIEGSIDDQSLIKSITIDSIYDASFRKDRLNPTFYANIEIVNKRSFQIKVEDYYGNITINPYYIEHERIEYDDNPMGRTWAIFIENSDYDSFEKLEGPQKDISMMKSLLDSKYNFTSIQTKKNLTKDELERFFSITMRDLVEKHRINSLLIWYAGHGSTIKDIGYWIPIDGVPNDEMSFYSLSSLKSAIESYVDDLTHLLVVSDACQSGPTFYDATRSANSNVNCNDDNIVNSKSLQVFTSSNSYELALDQSQFVEVFYNYLESNKTSCVPVDKIAKEIKTVLNERGFQSPQFGIIPGLKHGNGTYFFIKKEDN